MLRIDRVARFVFASFATVVLLAGGLWLSGYFMAGGDKPASLRASNDADQSSVALLQSMQKTLVRQEAEVQRAKREAGENIDALARKLAQLQADMMRINAAGQRMVKIAHINSDEFDFSKPAPVGGPDVSPSPQPDLVTSGMQTLDALQKRLNDRQRELAVLEDILRTSKLHKEIEPTGWPIKRGYISSPFGYRTDPFTGHRSFHPGIDLAGPKGETVHAVAAGIVVHAGPDGGYGKMVEINHGNGVETLYGHNEKILVHVGQKVLRGQPIAKEGSTGRATGPHCHFEVRINGRVVNPLRYLQASR